MKRAKTEPNMSTYAGRVRALRDRLGLTQEQLAERGGLTRVEVNKVEAGRNDASTWRVRDGIGFGLGLSRDEIANYLEGNMDLEAAARASRYVPTSAPPASAARPSDSSLKRRIRAAQQQPEKKVSTR